MPLTEEGIRQGMVGVGEDLRRQIPDDVGFIVIMRSKVNENSRAWYYGGNASEQEIVAMFKNVTKQLGAIHVAAPAVG